MTINISWIYINIGHIKIYAFSEICCVWILFFFLSHKVFINVPPDGKTDGKVCFYSQ